jgi:carbon-monoxide dehydrogenase large subunit
MARVTRSNMYRCCAMAKSAMSAMRLPSSSPTRLAQAQDASELIDIDWELGEAQADLATALDESPLVWPDLGTNQAYLYRIGDAAGTERPFAEADHVTTIDFLNNRLVCNYMEPRACLAEWDEAAVEVHADAWLTGGPRHPQDPRQGRVRHGSRGFPRHHPRCRRRFRHQVVQLPRIPAIAGKRAPQLGRPVKWVSDRTEHFLADAHGRDNEVTASLALDKEGRILGLKIDLLANMGGYLQPVRPVHSCTRRHHVDRRL